MAKHNPHATEKTGFLTGLHALLFFITVTAPVWMVGIFWFHMSHQDPHWYPLESHRLHWDDFFSYWGLSTPDQWMGAALWVVTITITWNLHMHVRRKIAEMPAEG